MLERKTGALDQAAPLAGWDLPEEYHTLRRRLEARMGQRGKREFVRVLRLMEDFSHQEVHHAVQDALLLCRIEGSATWISIPTCLRSACRPPAPETT